MTDELIDEIYTYVEWAVEDMNFFEYQIQVKIVGPMLIIKEDESDLMVNVDINGIDHFGHNLAIDLSIRLSDKSKNRDTPIRKAYRREMLLYNQIFRSLDKFFNKRVCGKDIFELIPIRFKTFSTEKREVLVFNSLVKQGFHTNRLPFHPELKFAVLKYMSKLHAGFLAFRNHDREEFTRLFEKWTPSKDLLLQPCVEGRLTAGLDLVFDMLEEEEEFELQRLLENDTKQGILDVISKILNDVPNECVLVHGDIWMGNILLKYRKNGIDPEKMKFIYWQLAALHSPVLDLAYFLYFTHTEETNQCFEQYVEYYYSEFCSLLIDLGSDPQKLLPFTTLLDHFVKYSIYPLILAMGGIPLIIIEEHSKGESSFLRDYKDFKYEKLSTELKHKIKTKILGILELHYKYFSQ